MKTLKLIKNRNLRFPAQGDHQTKRVFIQRGLKFQEQNIFSCRYLLINSLLLFSRYFLYLKFRMHNFSAKHSLQIFEPTLNAFARFTIDHLILNLVLLSFNSQMCLESAVLLACFLCLIDEVWPLKRDLKSCSIMPIYTLGSFSGV